MIARLWLSNRICLFDSTNIMKEWGTIIWHLIEPVRDKSPFACPLQSEQSKGTIQKSLLVKDTQVGQTKGLLNEQTLHFLTQKRVRNCIKLGVGFTDMEAKILDKNSLWLQVRGQSFCTHLCNASSMGDGVCRNNRERRERGGGWEKEMHCLLIILHT